jgi:periplasmic protein TonB
MRLKYGLIVTLFALVAVGRVGVAQEVPAADKETPPQVVREVKADYTEEAKKAGIQGSVLLDAVVLTDGTVGEVRVTRSLDTKYGLDAQAVKALKQWQFKPGTKDGKPVPVRVDVEMTFTLK